jgi:putative oxidoreductase
MQEHIAVSLIICYLTLSFAYSVIEKIMQWQSSKGYYTKHFQNTFLENHIPSVLLLVILMECISVLLSVFGLYRLFVNNETQISFWSLVSIAITLMVLMTGQRIAQDYSGAMNITVYFILAVMGIYIL